MKADRLLSFVSVVTCAVSLIAGLWGRNGPMAVASMLAFLYSIIVVIYGLDHRLMLFTSVILLVCTILITTVLSYETMVENGTMGKQSWIYLAGIVQAVPVLPIVLASFFVIAAVFGASYNWAVVTGLTVFIGLGILSGGYSLTYLFLAAGIEKGLMENAYILYGLLIGMFFLIAFTYVLFRIFKKNHYVITSDGLWRSCVDPR